MLVPNSEKAFIDLRKLVAYTLDPTHEVGKHKAAVFAKVLGLSRDNVNELVEALVFSVNNSKAEVGKLDRFGQRYVVDFEMSRNLRTATIRSVWIVDAGGDFPRLVTCFVL